MNSSQFKKYQLKKLCAIIGCKPNEVEYITSHTDDYYREWFETKLNKVTGELKKYKDGTIKQRAIRPSLRRLKIIQSAIKDKILSPLILPANIHGGVKKRNNITNAKPHQGNKFQFTTDLQDFYPNINNRQVYEALIFSGFSDHFAYWITKLTTWKSQLPQGTPTSTHIANIVFLETDLRLINFSAANNLIYTRYVDDLTFSSQQDFGYLHDKILNIIKDGGFNISYRKTDYKCGQVVTGIQIFNNFIDAPKKIKDKSLEEKLLESKSKPYSKYLERIRLTNKNITRIAS